MSTSNTDLKSIARDAEQLSGWINERRQHLHRNPELSFQEKETSAFVRREVEALGLAPSAPIADGKYGFYAELKSRKNPDRFVLLRADMDALPIQEENDVPFKSQKEGVGHLCGHDSHTSMLLGALKLLKDREADLPVSVRFIFQHAEEVAPGGAIDFVRAGACKDVVGCFGLHVSPRLSSGEFGLCKGEVMAMVGGLEVTVRGRGGHAAAPHECADPVLAASACVVALQQIASRRIAPIEPVVLSVTKIEGGTAFNVIPNEVKFLGTLRTFSEASGPAIEDAVKDICESTARAYGCEAIVKTGFTYPPVINNPVAVDVSNEAVTEMFGADASVTITKAMGAEDFAYFNREKPGSFVYIGVRPPGTPYYPLHHPQFLPDDSVFWKGSALLAAMPFVAPKYLLHP